MTAAELDKVREYVTASREAQGLPAQVTDESTLAQVAALLREDSP